LAEMARKAFVEAFAAFKAEAPAAIERTGAVGYESKKGGAVDYRHVELDVACEKLTPILSKHGLAHSWKVFPPENGKITVSCHLEHVDGHSRTVSLDGPADTSGSKNAIQAVGSTIYYLERYTFLAVVGIAQKDGDTDAGGNGALITDEQLTELNDRLKELIDLEALNEEKFLAWVKTTCKSTASDFQLADVPASVFPKIIHTLITKRKQVMEAKQ
jgi:hypothetical protein